MKKPQYRKFLLSLIIIITLASCAHYEIRSNNSNVLISFGNEKEESEKVRPFRIERKITFVGFDIFYVQKFDLDQAIQEELPRAKKIINLRINTQEDGLDSLIRLIGTGIQYLLVTDRALVSRRTIVIEGDVVEE